ncbi:ATP-binding protein [Bacteroidota bacterium]
MEKKKQIMDYCRRFKLGGVNAGFDTLLQEANTAQMGYMEYTLKLFAAEAAHRQEKDLQRRLKTARLPPNHLLDNYDYAADNGINKTKLVQLREMDWVDKLFNIVLMGPSGTGYVKQMIM